MLFFIDDFGVGLTDSASPPPTAREIDDFGVGLMDSASPPPTASEIDDLGAGLTDSARWPSQLSSGRASESVLGALFAPRAIFAHLALLHHAWRARDNWRQLATTGDNWRQELWSSSSRQLATTGDKNCGVVVVVVVQAGGY